MATLTFSRQPSPCGHQVIGVAIDGAPRFTLHVHVDALREARSPEQREQAMVAIIAEKLRGLTRAQAVAVFPFDVVI